MGLFTVDKEFTAYINKCRGADEVAIKEELNLTKNEKYFRMMGGSLAVLTVSSLILSIVAIIFNIRYLASISVLVFITASISMLFDILYINNRSFDAILHNSDIEKLLISKDAIKIYNKGEK